METNFFSRAPVVGGLSSSTCMSHLLAFSFRFWCCCVVAAGQSFTYDTSTFPWWGWCPAGMTWTRFSSQAQCRRTGTQVMCLRTPVDGVVSIKNKNESNSRKNHHHQSSSQQHHHLLVMHPRICPSTECLRALSALASSCCYVLKYTLWQLWELSL